MNGVMVYLAAIGFALFIFPVHLHNYVFINTSPKYASLNVGVYGLWNFFNLNTVEDKPGEMQINGKNKKIELRRPHLFFYRAFNMVYINKIVQLGDFGIKSDKNAYAALGQNALTYAVYKFIEANGGREKLRNYTILNEEHDDIRYYMKAVTIINALVVTKILMLFIWEKIK